MNLLGSNCGWLGRRFCFTGINLFFMIGSYSVRWKRPSRFRDVIDDIYSVKSGKANIELNILPVFVFNLYGEDSGLDYVTLFL